MRFWLLKGPPDDARQAATWLEANASVNWRFKKAAPDWSVGDAVFLWEGGGRTRLVGLAEVEAIEDPSGKGESRLRTLAGPLPSPLPAADLRADVLVGDAAFLQRNPRQVFPLELEEGRRLARLVSRRQKAGAEILERWFGAAVHRHKATVADGTDALDGTKPVVLVAVHDPKQRASLVAWAQEFWDDQVAVVECEDGRDAWSLALEHPPALFIVSELQTSLSGLEIGLKLKKQKQLASTKLVILGQTDMPDEELRSNFGAHVVIRKPLRKIEVEARVGALLEV